MSIVWVSDFICSKKQIKGTSNILVNPRGSPFDKQKLQNIKSDSISLKMDLCYPEENNIC